MSNVQIYSRNMKFDFSSNDLNYHQFFLPCKIPALLEKSLFETGQIFQRLKAAFGNFLFLTTYENVNVIEIPMKHYVPLLGYTRDTKLNADPDGSGEVSVRLAGNRTSYAPRSPI